MKVTRFENLEIWQIARRIYKYVYEITARSAFDNDRKLRAQMRASSGSMADNVAEGFDRGGNKEFCNFLSIAKGSCGEVLGQSSRSHDVKLITDEEFMYLIEESDKFCNKTSRLMMYLTTTRNKGVKFD